MYVQQPQETVFEDRGLPRVNGQKRVELRKEAQEENYKQLVKQKMSEDAKLDQLTQKSTQVLYELTTIWPFDFFTSKIVIHKDKVDVIDKFFFRSAQIITTPISRLLNVRLTTSILFAAIELELEGLPNLPSTPIRYLRKKEAINAVRIMNGLIVCSRENVDISKSNDLLSLTHKLASIGYSHEKGIGV